MLSYLALAIARPDPPSLRPPCRWQNVEFIGNAAAGGETSEGVGGALALEERCNDEACR